MVRQSTCASVVAQTWFQSFTSMAVVMQALVQHLRTHCWTYQEQQLHQEVCILHGARPFLIYGHLWPDMAMRLIY